MKKKFINGILMVAMLFAATTSFVSCKDNVDDQLVDVYATIEQVRANLQNQLDDLKNRVTSLEGRMDAAEAEIQKLWAETQRLQGEIDALDVRVKNLEDRVDAIEARLDELEARVSTLEEMINEQITDIFVKETNTPIIGTINLPAIHDNFLGAFYAQIVTDIDAFPYESQKDDTGWIQNGVTVDQENGNRLIGQEISNKVTRVKFKKYQMDTNFEGNAGTLYFSLNPVDVNIDNVTFSLVNSLGNPNPVELSGVKKSAHKLTWAIGKHGNGTVEDTDAENIPSGYLYEATATMPITNIMDNDFPYMNVWKQAAMTEDIQAMIEEVKAAEGKSAKVKAVSKYALQLVQNWYQSELDLRKNMAYWDLQAEKTLSDGTTKKYVGNDHITIATVRPLSYNFFWTIQEGYGKDLLKSYIDIDDIGKAAAAIAEAAYKTLGDVDLSSLKSLKVESGKFLAIFDDGGTVPVGYVDAAEYPIDAVALAVKELGKKFKTAAADGDISSKVSEYLSKVSNKIATVLGDHVAYRAVAPIVLFLGPDGVNRLVPGATLQQEFPTSTFIFTSPTEEYLVPAMYKYIAVLKEGKPIEAYVEAGWNKVQDLNLPEGDCEIVYQVMDFNGYVITKRYPIHVEK
jgi:chaperonin cofactor prefoldin